MAGDLTAFDLQVVQRCGRLYELGYKPPEPVLQAVTRTALERLLIQHLIKPFPQVLLAVPAYVDGAIKHLKLLGTVPPEQLKMVYHHACAFLTELLTVFDFPVAFGPLPWKRVISRTEVTTHISAVLADMEKRVLHAFYFTQYVRELDLLNDPVPALLTDAFTDLTRKPYELVVHALAESDAAPFLTHKIVSARSIKPVENLVKVVEQSLFFPATPCPLKSCPHKGVCPQ